jgi:NAD(P)-dependent dehydrogenase (short-subunit alcohol dehydrogenase family)
MRLAGRVAIVTGAARGIGQTLALRLAREGATVIAADKSDVCETTDKIRGFAGNVKGVCVDVANAASTRTMAEQTAQAYGRIDVLVNNAALWGGLKMKGFDEIPEEEWDQVFAVNTKGVWQCCKAVYPLMRRQNAGSIINISSASILQGVPFLGHYVASKGAVWAFTRSLSRELGPFGIRVNSITPGYTATQASKEITDDPEKFEANNRVNIDSRVMPRAMMPEDIEGAVVFLASDDSSFISGQNLNVDGGSVHY